MPATPAVEPEPDVAYDDVEPTSRLPLGSTGRTADWDDAHRSWTVQSAKPMPKTEDGPVTFFHPSELPDPDVAMAAGFVPLVNPGHLVKSDHVTEPPSGNYPVDHPSRDVHRRPANTSVGPASYGDAYAKAKELTTVSVEDAEVETAPSPADRKRVSQAKLTTT